MSDPRHGSLSRSTTPSLPSSRWVGSPCLALVYEFNERFLTLLSQLADPDAGPPPPDFVRMHQSTWQALDAAACQRASRCPFLLVDIHFRDTRWWHWASTEAAWRGREPALPGLLPSKLAVEVLHEALILAWHTAQWHQRAAGLLLGMSSEVCDIIARLGLRTLRLIAVHCHRHLCPRWEHLTSFWDRFLTTACGDNTQELRDLFWAGVQMLNPELSTSDLLQAIAVTRP